MIAEILMNLGTLLLAIAAIPQFISVWKNRHDLKGYSVLGSAVVFVSLVLIATSFFLMRMWVSVLAQALPLILWFLVTVYSMRTRRNEYHHELCRSCGAWHDGCSLDVCLHGIDRWKKEEMA